MKKISVIQNLLGRIFGSKKSILAVESTPLASASPSGIQKLKDQSQGSNGFKPFSKLPDGQLVGNSLSDLCSSQHDLNEKNSDNSSPENENIHGDMELFKKKQLTNHDQVDTVYNLIILDESGSMDPVKQKIMDLLVSVHSYINQLKSDMSNVNSYFSFVSFANQNIKYHEWNKYVDNNLSSTYHYAPDGSTNLLDACCESLLKLEKDLKKKDNYRVFVTIITDGEENSSIKYTMIQTRDLITRLKSTGRWYFAYFGADHNVEAVKTSLNLDECRSFFKTESGIDQLNYLVCDFLYSRYANVNIKPDKTKNTATK